jgi:hypothetical protein
MGLQNWWVGLVWVAATTGWNGLFFGWDLTHSSFHSIEFGLKMQYARTQAAAVRAELPIRLPQSHDSEGEAS